MEGFLFECIQSLIYRS